MEANEHFAPKVNNNSGVDVPDEFFSSKVPSDGFDFGVVFGLARDFVENEWKLGDGVIRKKSVNGLDEKGGAPSF